MGPECRITLFGGLRVTCGEREIARFRTQKAAWLLAYLALNAGKPIYREQLAELLWPEAPPEASRNRLKQELSGLRRDLETLGLQSDTLILADRTVIELDSNKVAVDVAEFVSLLSSAASAEIPSERAWFLVQAADLHKGDFLPGCLEDWAVAESDRLAEMYIGACQSAARALMESGDLESATLYAQNAVRADRLREESHCLLMQISLAQGRPAAALLQYRELEGVLRDELDVEPGEEARRLAESCSSSERRFGDRTGRGRVHSSPSSASPQATSGAISPSTVFPSLPAAKRRLSRAWLIAIPASLILLLAMYLSGFVGHRTSGTKYAVSDLGLLPGTPNGLAMWVGNDGQVAGFCSTATGVRPFVADPGQRAKPVALPRGYEDAQDATVPNAAGEMACTIGQSGDRRAFIVDPKGAVHMLERPAHPGLGGFTCASAINDDGWVSGVCGTASGVRACRWDPQSRLRLLDEPNTHGGDLTGMLASPINRTGEVAGSFVIRTPGVDFQHAAMWDREGHIRDLGTLPGGSKSNATCLNDRGQIAGHSDSADGQTHPFLYGPQTGMKQIPVPSGGSGQVHGINNRGEVVGDYGPGPRAFYWSRERGSIDLNSKIDPASGWVLITARSISDTGYIAGNGLYKGQVQPFRMKPFNR